MVVTPFQICVIIAVILMIIYLIHTMTMKRTQGYSGRVVVGGTFKITIDDITPNNHHYKNGPSKVFYVNGEEAPTIRLNKGFYYEFINTTDEPFYLTTDKNGGPGSPGVIAKNKNDKFRGLTNGTVFLKVTGDLPKTFYYQSSKTKNMGSVIKIH